MGDTVFHRAQRESKADDCYEGPFKILEILRNGHYLIGNSKQKFEAPTNFLSRNETSAGVELPLKKSPSVSGRRKVVRRNYKEMDEVGLDSRVG